MTCELVQDAIFGDGERPEAFDAHLAACAACREALAGHRAALKLEGAEVFVPPVRADLSKRRPLLVTLAALLVLCVPVSVKLFSTIAERKARIAAQAPAGQDALTDPGGVLPLTAPPVESSMKAPSAVTFAGEPLDDEQRAWLEVWRSSNALAWEVRRDVSVVDPSYAAFRSLPAWLAPRPVALLDDGSLTHAMPQE